MADDAFDPEPDPRRPSPRRSERAAARRTYRRRRLLAGGGVLVVFVLLLGVSGVVYGVWKFNQLDRKDLDLPEVASGEPQNYLIVGSDSRAPDTEVPEGGAKVAGPVEGKRSDTILVVRIDPDEQKAKMLSLPRDLWVTLADTGEHQRINAAFNHGEQALVDTITAELDIPINHFLEVDFNGFQGLVDAVDGVPMYFDRAIRDTHSGLEVLHPGCITLDPTQALAFARSRHLEYIDDGEWESDPTGDLGRISRQQLFMRRSISRAVERGLRNPLTLKKLVDVGAKNVSVDDELSVRSLMALGRRFAEFDAERLETYTLPVDPDRTDGGADILRLREAEAQSVLTLFRDAPDPDDPPTTSAATFQPTSAPVQVMNGSGVNGQAKQVSVWIEQIGFTAGTTGNASEIGLDGIETTLIRHGPDGLGQANLLASRLVGGVEIEEDPGLERDELMLVTGSDFDGVKDDAGKVLGAGGPANASAQKTTTTTATTAPPPSGDAPTTTTTTVIGRTPGDPPPGETCG